MQILITLTSILVLIMILKNWVVVITALAIAAVMFIIYKILEKISFKVMTIKQIKKDKIFEENLKKKKNKES